MTSGFRDRAQAPRHLAWLRAACIRSGARKAGESVNMNWSVARRLDQADHLGSRVD